jgi:signal transduction histidine kinase
MTTPLAFHPNPWLPAWLRAVLARRPHLQPMSVVMAFTLGTIAAIWLFAALYLSGERERALAAARVTAASYARAVEEHAVRTFEAADQTVVYFKHQVETQGTHIDVAHYLHDGIVMGDIFNLISILDEKGDLTGANQPFTPRNLSDREYFRVQLQRDTGRLDISKPVLGRLSGKWSIQMTRRANKPDGSLLGVVVISMDPLYFTHFYQQIEPGTQTLVSLVGLDGVVRARRVGATESLGQDVSDGGAFGVATSGPQAGFFDGKSTLDGHRRVVAYRRLTGYPLFVMVGIDENEALMPFNRARTHTLAWALGSTLFIMLFFQVMKGLIGRLEASRHAALAASKAKSEFLATMSHELRTPLHGILGYAELLAEEVARDPDASFVAAIRQSGEHLLRLVNDVLDLGRIEAGHMELNLEAVALSRLLREVESTHRASAELKALDLVFMLDPRLPESIQTDATKLKQLLNNLVHNAIKFTERGSVMLSARNDAGQVRFEVIDTGCGIPASAQERVFEKFVQVDSRLARGHAGTGLGLALVRELAGLLGATVRLESQPGKGSRFTVLLPIRTVPVKEEPMEIAA